MTIILFTFILAFLFTLVVTPLVKKLAVQYNLGDDIKKLSPAIKFSGQILVAYFWEFQIGIISMSFTDLQTEE